MNEPTKFRLLMKNVNVNTKVSEIKKFFKPVRIKDAKILKRGIAVAYFKSEGDLNTCLEKEGTLHGDAVKITPYEHDLFANTPKPSDSKLIFDSVPVDKLISEIQETGRLFIRNLSYECTEDELLKQFSPFGTISEIHLSYDPKLQRSRGFAFITFLFPNDAVTAFKMLDKHKFKDRLLHILPGKPLENAEKSTQKRKTEIKVDGMIDENDIEDRTLTSEYQKKKQADLKATASVSHNWNALFISPDAVSTYLAAKFGVTKEQLLDANSKEPAAVRLAHGEAQLIHELRDFLIKAGVRLDLLEDQQQKSSLTSILTGSGRRDKLEAQAATTHRQLSGNAFIIKNMPVGTSEVEVRELIQRLTRSGASQLEGPRRVILPPLGITAIVEYTNPQIARLAYKALSYEPFKDNVLFLQWAIEGILAPNATSEEVYKNAEQTTPEETSRTKNKKRQKLAKHYEEEEEDANIPETMADLIDTENVVEIEEGHAISLEETNEKPKKSKKRHRHEDDSVPVQEEEEAKDEFEIVKEPKRLLQKANLEDFPGEDTTSTTRNRIIMVRNVAFQASQSELTALFKPIGGLVKVRMPQKASGGHRGFAFIEFASEAQAQSALETFGAGTHFFGRRLNIEYANSV